MDALNCSIFMNYQHHKDRKLGKKSFSKIFFAGIWGKKASKLKNVFGNTFFSNQFVTLRYYKGIQYLIKWKPLHLPPSVSRRPSFVKFFKNQNKTEVVGNDIK